MLGWILEVQRVGFNNASAYFICCVGRRKIVRCCLQDLGISIHIVCSSSQWDFILQTQSFMLLMGGHGI